MKKNLKLSPDDLAKLTQYEASISHWSNEYTVLILKSKKALEGIDSLYQARQKLIDELLKSNDINLTIVDGVDVSPNGDVTVSIKETK